MKKCNSFKLAGNNFGYFVLGFLIIGFLLLGLFVEFNSITGNAVIKSGEVVKSPVSYLTGLVVDSQDEELVERFDKDIDLEIKKPVEMVGEVVSENKNERMEFVGDENIRLYFEMLNYSEFVKGADYLMKENGLIVEDINDLENENRNSESEQSGYGEEDSGFIVGISSLFFGMITGRVIESGDTGYGLGERIDIIGVKDNIDSLSKDEIELISEGSVVELDDSEFEVVVNESLASDSSVDYKWGYEVKLKDLQFMAKIDISSEKEIKVVDNSSLRIENKVLSFNDLVKRGYSVRIDTPYLIVNETNRRVINVTDVNVTLDDEINITLIENITKENVSIKNKTKINASVGNESERGVEIIGNDSNGDFSNISESGNKSEVSDKEADKRIEENIEEQETGIKEEKDKDEKEKNKKVKEEKNKEKSEKLKNDFEEEDKGKIEEVKEEQTGYGVDKGITGDVIKWIVGVTGRVTGFAVNAVVSEVKDIKYNNSVIVYIERDFRGVRVVESENNIGNLENESESEVNEEIEEVGELRGVTGRVVNSDKENKGSQKSVTRMITNSYQGINNYKDNNYINFSVDSNNVETGVVSGMVTEQSDELYLLPGRSPGSIPGHAVSTSSDNTSNLQDESDVEQAEDENHSLGQFEDINNSIGNLQNKSEGGQTSERNTSQDGLIDTNISTEKPSEAGFESLEEEENSNTLVIGVDFFDVDGNGELNVDDIIYLDPSLIIIPISDAEHLNENRSFIGDIYNETKEQDDVWSEVISDRHYVRATFESELNRTKDISVYARVVDKCEAGDSFVVINGSEIGCDVYEKKKRIDELKGLLGGYEDEKGEEKWIKKN